LSIWLAHAITFLQGFDAAKFSIPLSYCSRYGERALSNVQFSVLDTNTGIGVQRRLWATDQALSDLETTLMPELETWGSYVMHDMVCIQWRGAAGAKFPHQGRLQVSPSPISSPLSPQLIVLIIDIIVQIAVTILDGSLPVTGTEFVVVGKYDFSFRQGAIGATFSQGPPPVIENENKEDIHVRSVTKSTCYIYTRFQIA
jgi:hypothetical protein